RGPLSGPRGARSRLRVNSACEKPTCLACTNANRRSRDALLLLLGGLLLRRGLLLGLAGRLLPHGHSYLLRGFRSGSRCVWTINDPRREPPATVDRNPTAREYRGMAARVKRRPPFWESFFK